MNHVKVVRAVSSLSLFCLLAGCATEANDMAESPTGTASSELKGSGGGGGTGGGGVKTTGAIDTVSAVATCTAGTVMTVTFRKANNNQIELQMTVAAGVTPAPSGFLDVNVANLTTGTSQLAFGSWPTALVTGLSITTLGHQAPIGASTLAFSAVLYDGTSAAGAVLESCTATVDVFAR